MNIFPGPYFVSPGWRCPFSSLGNNYKDYLNIFLGPNFVSLELRCPKGEVPLQESFRDVHPPGLLRPSPVLENFPRAFSLSPGRVFEPVVPRYDAQSKS